MNKKKRIGILTLPIKSNYGGILQAFALQHYLKEKGYDAWLIRRRWNCNHQSRMHKMIKYIYHTLIIRKFNNFINKYIYPQTSIIDINDNMKHLNSIFDAFIVGSDQIWRMRYVTGVGYNYFLDFVDNDKKKIAYAASFGVSYWDDDNPNINIPIVKNLLKRFDMLSVREKTGINICKNKFEITPHHVIDPTLLLKKEDYYNIFNITCETNSYLAVYILDITTEKMNLAKQIANKLGLKLKIINRSLYSTILPTMLKDQIKPGMISWLNGIAQSSFVITDSFHGTVFSILFHKQFYSIDNTHRGSDRFISILSDLDLQKRLIDIKTPIKLSFSKIDYNIVEKKLEKLRIHSSNLLLNSLN